MNEKVMLVLLGLLILLLEAALVWAEREMWKMEERVGAILFVAMTVVSTCAFGYLIIGGLMK